jgi:hypothetical protein
MPLLGGCFVGACRNPHDSAKLRARSAWYDSPLRRLRREFFQASHRYKLLIRSTRFASNIASDKETVPNFIAETAGADGSIVS